MHLTKCVHRVLFRLSDMIVLPLILLFLPLLGENISVYYLECDVMCIFRIENIISKCTFYQYLF